MQIEYWCIVNSKLCAYVIEGLSPRDSLTAAVTQILHADEAYIGKSVERMIERDASKNFRDCDSSRAKPKFIPVLTVYLKSTEVIPSSRSLLPSI